MLGQTLGGIVGGMILIRDASDVAGISAQPLGWDVSDVGMHNNPQLFVGMIKFYASGSHQRIAIRTVAVLEQNEDFPCWTYIEPYKSRRA